MPSAALVQLDLRAQSSYPFWQKKKKSQSLTDQTISLGYLLGLVPSSSCSSVDLLCPETQRNGSEWMQQGGCRIFIVPAQCPPETISENTEFVCKYSLCNTAGPKMHLKFRVFPYAVYFRHCFYKSKDKFDSSLLTAEKQTKLKIQSLVYDLWASHKPRATYISYIY